MEMDVCTFMCDFNGRWLKDSSLLWNIAILLSEEGIIVDIRQVIQVRCVIKLIILYFF